MLNAARVHGSPMIVIAMKIAAITQPAAIHRPPKRIHKRLSKKEKADMAFLRDLRTMGLSWVCFGVPGLDDLRMSSTSLQDVLPAIVG